MAEATVSTWDRVLPQTDTPKSTKSAKCCEPIDTTGVVFVLMAGLAGLAVGYGLWGWL